MAIVFLWRLRLQAVPLGTSYLPSALCVTRQKNFSRPEICFHVQWTNRKRQYSSDSLSNSDSSLCEGKALCGTTSPRVTVLALFYESVNRLTETKEIEKKTTTRTQQQKQIGQKN